MCSAQKHVMFTLRGKDALALYEMVQERTGTHSGEGWISLRPTPINPTAA